VLATQEAGNITGPDHYADMVRDQPRQNQDRRTIGPATGTAEGCVRSSNQGWTQRGSIFSHGTREEHAERARLIRDVQETIAPAGADRRSAGPEAPDRQLPDPVTLARGDEVVVTGDESSRNGELPVLPAVIGEVLQPGPRGADRRRPGPPPRRAHQEWRAECAVLAGGIVSAHKA